MLKRAKAVLAGKLAEHRKRRLVAQGGAPPDWYDHAYGGAVDEYTTHYSESRYLPVWEAICHRLPTPARILEVGCGPGQLAQLLLDRGDVDAYVGFDFSPQAIELAKENLPGSDVRVDDARTTNLFAETDYDSVICTEVLEHIVDDLLVLQRIPSGKQILATVPDFDYESHVRFFADSQAVRDRYGNLFHDLEVSTHHHTGDAGGHHGTFFLLNGHVK